MKITQLQKSEIQDTIMVREWCPFCSAQFGRASSVDLNRLPRADAAAIAGRHRSAVVGLLGDLVAHLEHDCPRPPDPR